MGLGMGDEGQNKVECQIQSQGNGFERCIKSSEGGTDEYRIDYEAGNERSIGEDVATWRCGDVR
jgi:hypothetical protein